MNPFDVLKNMLILLQKADGINRFFIDNDINHVAIYGLGCIGQRVYEEVKRCGIAVDFAIDKDADCIESEEVRIVKPEELRKCENDTELIIVTPMDYYYEIKESIEEMTVTDVISIGEIIAYCMDGETFCQSFRRREIDSPSNDAVGNADVECEEAEISVENKLLGGVQDNQTHEKSCHGLSNKNTERSRKVLVFGGGSGIGKAIAFKMAEDGAKVVIAGRSENKLVEVSNEIGKDKCNFMVADISDVDKHKDFFKEASEIMGGLDAFVNCAAISLEARGRGYEPWDITDKEWDEVADVNLKGAYFLMRNEIDYFKENHISGNILNFASNAAYMDILGIYGVSKLSVAKWTKAFGKRFGHDGIVINAIAPGATFTPMISSYAQDINQPYPRHAIERFIRPDEIANLAWYLLSDNGEILCGETVVADGGDSNAVL